MEKFTSEISKKIFPTASTFTRAMSVGVLGIVIVSDPSLGVLGFRTVGKVLPPSVEREIFTLAALTGAPAVPATSHRTVKLLFTCTLKLTFGEVTANGPELPSM